MNEVDYLTSTSALELKEVPQRLAVIGSGYIAAELGQMFSQPRNRSDSHAKKRASV
ncbi:Mercuric reductase [Staphylococcus aureus]|uniref:Mercuric reductase n=1 Tax=Staphylococcus aureus TaxID=1280 RepID=A0A8S1IAX2_STAAU|nr:Mercuric reductase [Staphylococcus aureus]